MSDRDNVMKPPADETNPSDAKQQEGDVVREIETDELETVAGGSDGWAVGHN